jgi:endonuclease/exonuclease/phosphatase family metal-dependent hydrolase
MSLSEQARRASTAYVQALSPSLFSIPRLLGGDFNAEEWEISILNLLKEPSRSLQSTLDGELVTNGDGSSTLKYVDIGSMLASDTTQNTFPVNDPVKRIDFILVQSASLISGHLDVIGNIPYELLPEQLGDLRISSDPLGDNIVDENLIKQLLQRKLLGVFEPDALLWASDHFGLLATIVFI